MTGTEIAAIIAAVAGLLTAAFAGFRAMRGDKVSADAAAAAGILLGLQGLVTTLQGEVKRLTDDAAQHRIDCDEERKAWRAERAAIRAEHLEEMKEAYERMDELGSQLYVALNRPTDARTRATDRDRP